MMSKIGILFSKIFLKIFILIQDFYLDNKYYCPSDLKECFNDKIGILILFFGFILFYLYKDIKKYFSNKYQEWIDSLSIAKANNYS